MAAVFACLSATAAAAAALLLFLHYRSVGLLAEKLREINGSHTCQKLSLPMPGRPLEALAVEINRLIDLKRQSETASQRKEAELRRSIANISHDLRTPLTSVIGYLGLLADDALPAPQRRKYISIVRRHADVLSSLVSDFFDLSLLDSGGCALECRPLRLQQILCEQMALFYNDFTSRGLTPAVSVDESVPPALSDEASARRVYENLIQNTLRHGKGPVSVTFRRRGGLAVTEFENAAPGLTQESASRLFEQFFTADRTRGGKNAGIGLAIARSLAERTGGGIEAEFSNGRLLIRVWWKIAGEKVFIPAPPS